MKFALASLLLPHAVKGYELAGYTAASDVTAHAAIDLDLRDIKADLDLGTADGNAAALTKYQDGAGNSVKSSGATRSIGGFWNVGKKTNEFDFSLQLGAGYVDSWGDDYTETSISSETVPVDAKLDAMKYIVIKGYVMHELIDAAGDYANERTDDNDGGVFAWDEGWAFWVGSAAAHLQYSDSSAEIQAKVLAEYQAGQTIIAETYSEENEATLWGHIYKIHELMNLDVIKGLFEHAGATEPTTANIESAKVFAQMIYPDLKACGGGAAATLKANTFDYSSDDGFMINGFADGVYTPIMETLECLQLTCADIAGASGTDGQTCVNAPYSAPSGISETIAGYVPGSDVHPHNRLDIDINRMGQFMKAGDWANAEKVYTGGWNSKKSSGDNRKLQGFSKGITSKQDAVRQFPDYLSYWGDDYEYSDKWIMSLLSGDKSADDVTSATAREQMIAKAIVSENVFIYTLREFEDAVNDCNAERTDDNDGGVHAWDEGVAFYTGVLIGADADSTSSNGKLLYTLANKRCGNFGTCDSTTGNSKVNKNLFTHFTAGRDHLTAFECDEAEALIPTIFQQMLVPNIQGALRYAWKADPEGMGGGDKEFAEGWAFARAILPPIAACPGTAAAVKIIEDNMDFHGGLGQISGGHDEVYRAIESAYTCLGLTCEDIGDLTASNCDEGGCPETTKCQWTAPVDPPTDNDDLQGPAASAMLSAGIAAVVGLVAALV